jgi:hypothetical protein
MTIALDEDTTTPNRSARQTKWLARLEQELKRRIGWADEAVSPFGRDRGADDTKPAIKPAIRHAA